jgi:hypothetical protein
MVLTLNRISQISSLNGSLNFPHQKTCRSRNADLPHMNHGKYLDPIFHALCQPMPCEWHETITNNLRERQNTPTFAGYERPAYVDRDFSLLDWTNTICRYLHRLHSTHFSDREPLIVILDTYSTHGATIMQDLALSLNINPLFILPGCTGGFQPLYRGFSVC